jgi:hypothetical protein
MSAVPSEVERVAGEQTLVAPVPGYDGDYWLTEGGDVISLKGDEPAVVEPSGDDGVKLFKNGQQTTFSLRTLYDEVFGTDEVYNDARLALDLHLDYDDLEISDIADIVPLSEEAVRQVIRIYWESPRDRERWAKPR